MTISNNRDSFAFPAEIYSALSLLDADIQLSLYQSIMAYCISRTVPDLECLKPVARAFWMLILPTLNRINDRADRSAAARHRHQQKKAQSAENVQQFQEVTPTIDLQNTTILEAFQTTAPVITDAETHSIPKPEIIPETQPDTITIPAESSITTSPPNVNSRPNRHSNPSTRFSRNQFGNIVARPRVTLRDIHRSLRHSSPSPQHSTATQ